MFKRIELLPLTRDRSILTITLLTLISFPYLYNFMIDYELLLLESPHGVSWTLILGGGLSRGGARILVRGGTSNKIS